MPLWTTLNPGASTAGGLDHEPAFFSCGSPGGEVSYRSGVELDDRTALQVDGIADGPAVARRRRLRHQRFKGDPRLTRTSGRKKTLAHFSRASCAVWDDPYLWDKPSSVLVGLL